MQNKSVKVLPHKTLTGTRLIKLELRLPRNIKFGITEHTSPVENTKRLDQHKNVIKNFEYFQRKFKANTMLKLFKWSVPQPIDSNSPQGKNLEFIRDSIRSEAKLDKISRRISPEIDFFRQTMRLPMPQPFIHEEGRHFYGKRASSTVKQRKKIVLVGEKDIKEYEFVSRKQISKTPLRKRLADIN